MWAGDSAGPCFAPLLDCCAAAHDCGRAWALVSATSQLRLMLRVMLCLLYATCDEVRCYIGMLVQPDILDRVMMGWCMMPLQGCGCGTCYYAWGSQAGCSEAAAPGATSGHGGWYGTYTGSMIEVAGGEFLPITGGEGTLLRMYCGNQCANIVCCYCCTKVSHI